MSAEIVIRFKSDYDYSAEEMDSVEDTIVDALLEIDSEIVAESIQVSFNPKSDVTENDVAKFLSENSLAENIRLALEISADDE